ncbi:nuclear transport factor 2 family protein [Caulobacter sp. 602-1]|uniref:nuclear transport factor 2 family protein n=1 Tax=Caulobacter sp. 602-1 TaxID=2492472 RepID=UPI000F637D91|nr:nuclear transport factor 2 family protein [Caulobacter sp. 602-1]RRN62869.1 nuclear transport factor 2 family protein [Caulobacter sp. 602-1]
MAREQALQTLETWHDLLEKREFDRLRPLAAETVVFRSPAFFTPYPGVEPLVHIIATVNTIFEDFAYHREFWSEGHEAVVLEFSARVGDKKLKGIDIISFDDAGRIKEFEVMIRPANAAAAVGEAMAAKAGPRLKELLSKPA